MRYGLYDTKDHCWIGDDNGPRLFSPTDQIPSGPRKGDPFGEDGAFIFARMAAQVTDTMLRQAPGRTVAKVYTEDANVMKDEVTTAMTAEQALRRLQKGQF